MAREIVAALYALQQLDLHVERAATEAEALRRTLAEDATRPEREAAARARRRAEQARGTARDAEAEVHAAEERIERLQERLYGGGSGQRDLTALQRELEHLKAAHAEQEERVLALMLASEEAEGERARAAQASRAAERDWERRRAELAARLTQLEADLAELRGRRQREATALDGGAVARYEAIRRAHGGRGVAAVQGGTCQGCRVLLTSGELQRARAAAELVTCTNCGRILFVQP
jgi:predicted  nucleic acid-binding Zn-ribbon protein